MSEDLDRAFKAVCECLGSDESFVLTTHEALWAALSGVIGAIKSGSWQKLSMET